MLNRHRQENRHAQQQSVQQLPLPAALVGLLLLAMIPPLMGEGLPKTYQPLLTSPPPRIGSPQAEGVELLLEGEDGSKLELFAGSLQMEAADSGGWISTSKALVARHAVVHSLGRPFPKWEFARLQIRHKQGPFEWFGPARKRLADGAIEELESPKGSLAISAGTPVVSPRAR
jgi:hypothetical protein